MIGSWLNIFFISHHLADEKSKLFSLSIFLIYYHSLSQAT